MRVSRCSLLGIKGGVDAEDAPCRSTGLVVVLVWVDPAFNGRQGVICSQVVEFPKAPSPTLIG
jgi:hypothetical protein